MRQLEKKNWVGKAGLIYGKRKDDDTHFGTRKNIGSLCTRLDVLGIVVLEQKNSPVMVSRV